MGLNMGGIMHRWRCGKPALPSRRFMRQRAIRGRVPECASAVGVSELVTVFKVRISGEGVNEHEESHTEYLTFETRKRREMVHITDEVEQIVRRSGVKDGLCFVSPMHITAAVYVNDHESGLIEDIGKWLEELAPARPDYKHHQTGEDNGDAHLKSLLLHHETTLPVTNGKLDLGTWQRVFYAEFDGQRRKRVIVKVLGSGVRKAAELAEPSAGAFLREARLLFLRRSYGVDFVATTYVD